MRNKNKLEGMKGLISFVLIAFIVIGMVYCMYMQQKKHQESKVVTDPIILTNPGGVNTYDIEELEDVEDFVDDAKESGSLSGAFEAIKKKVDSVTGDK